MIEFPTYTLPAVALVVWSAYAVVAGHQRPHRIIAVDGVYRCRDCGPDCKSIVPQVNR